MLTDQEKLVLAEAASILHLQARDYKDKHDRLADMQRQHEKYQAQAALEKYTELNKLGNELTVIAGGDL